MSTREGGLVEGSRPFALKQGGRGGLTDTSLEKKGSLIKGQIIAGMG